MLALLLVPVALANPDPPLRECVAGLSVEAGTPARLLVTGTAAAPTYEGCAWVADDDSDADDNGGWERTEVQRRKEVRPLAVGVSLATGGTVYVIGSALGGTQNPRIWVPSYPTLNPSSRSDRASDIMLYAAFASPLLAAAATPDHERLADALVVANAVATTGLVTLGAKEGFARYRPYVQASAEDLWTATEGTDVGYFEEYKDPDPTRVDEDGQGWSDDAGHSFPSGHTSIAGAAAGSLAFLCVDAQTGPCTRPAWKVTSVVAGALATSGMGYLRVDAGAHYPGDVAAGGLLGIVSGVLTAYIVNEPRK